MTSRHAPIAFLACGALAQDVAAIARERGWAADVHGISAELHLTPLEIAPAVDARLRALTRRYERVIVVYGDCGTGGRLDAVLKRHPAVRPAGVHCFQWYSGELFARAADDLGIYFLTDWLVQNWDRAVVRGLGLDRFPWLKDEYFGNLTRILFVRQHADAERETRAREIAAWIGVPLEIHDVGSAPLEELLAPLVEAADTNGGADVLT